ncbi:hypothetical protein EON63_14165 [archaeon]|nr:MAG: hypothetical protein EON63_14165 [archaeon]
MNAKRASHFKDDALFAFVFAIVGFGLIVAWIDGDDLDFDLRLFNYHPVFMSLAFCFAICAVMSYSASSLPRGFAKRVHAFVHVATLVFISVGTVSLLATTTKTTPCQMHVQQIVRLRRQYQSLNYIVLCVF